VAIIAASLISVSITSISAQSQYEIPSWVKGVANFWAEGNINDAEFGESLSFLIDSGIINVPLIDELENKINNLQSENKDLKGQITNLERQNTDLRNQLNRPTAFSPQSSNEITTKPQSDLNYPKVTKRIDGEDAKKIILALANFHASLTSSEKYELANYAVEQSQFTVGILYAGNWILEIMETNDPEYGYDEGIGVSVFPFDCSHNIEYIYAIAGGKQDETGKMSLWLFKNGVLIDSESSEKPYGLPTMGGVCDKPSIDNSFG